MTSILIVEICRYRTWRSRSSSRFFPHSIAGKHSLFGSWLLRRSMYLHMTVQQEENLTLSRIRSHFSSFLSWSSLSTNLLFSSSIQCWAWAWAWAWAWILSLLEIIMHCHVSLSIEKKKNSLMSDHGVASFEPSSTACVSSLAKCCTLNSVKQKENGSRLNILNIETHPHALDGFMYWTPTCKTRDGPFREQQQGLCYKWEFPPKAKARREFSELKLASDCPLWSSTHIGIPIQKAVS